MFAAALLDRVNLWTNPKCPSTGPAGVDCGPSAPQETSQQVTPICLCHGNSLKPSTVLSTICIYLATVWFWSPTLDYD